MADVNYNLREAIRSVFQVIQEVQEREDREYPWKRRLRLLIPPEEGSTLYDGAVGITSDEQPTEEVTSEFGSRSP